MDLADRIDNFRIRPSKRKTSRGRPSEGQGMLATMVLMYLAFGEDYALNMSKKFKDEITEKNGFNEWQMTAFSSLRDQSQLHPLLKGMEKEGFLISRSEEVGRKRKYFSLSPNLLHALGGSEDRINELLEALSKEDRDPYLKKWSRHGLYKFATLIYFLRYEASKRGMVNLACELSKRLDDMHFKGIAVKASGDEFKGLAAIWEVLHEVAVESNFNHGHKDGALSFEHYDIFLKAIHDPSNGDIHEYILFLKNKAINSFINHFRWSVISDTLGLGINRYVWVVPIKEDLVERGIRRWMHIQFRINCPRD